MRLYQRLTPGDRRIRPLPYPYRGALALSSDVEFFDVPAFEAVMAFLNGTGQTPLGMGLGLEVTASMFFYSAPRSTLSYFDGAAVNAPRSEAADRLAEYLRSGWIDTNHSFGDFDAGNRFQREHALAVYGELDRLGVQLRVYTDHGGTDNLQNVGPGSPAYHLGDVPGSGYYHADLLGPNGVRFVWSDAGMWTERSAALPGTAASVDTGSWLTSLNGLFRETAATSEDRGPYQPPVWYESLLGPYVLQDGQHTTRFVRMRSTGEAAPNFSSLGAQLSQIEWPRFYEDSGVVVLYQHLGVLHRVKGACTPTSVEALKERPELYLAPLHFMASERDSGRLWVSGVERLLRYAQTTDVTRVTVENGVYNLVCADGTTGQARWSFEGITVYIDRLSEFVGVRHGGRDLPLVFNGPDETGRYSVTVATARLPQIW